MAAPTATATLNKTNFAPGETIVLTIDHADVDRQVITIAGAVTDSQGNVAPWSVSAVIDDGAVTINETAGKTWTLLSATLNQSVFTSTD